MDGSWIIDHSRSEAISAFLIHVGVPWVGRIAADNMTPTMQVSHPSADQVCMKRQTMFRSSEETLKLDGSECEVVGQDGNPTKMTARYSDGDAHRVLVTVVNVPEGSGGGVVTSTYTCADDGSAIELYIVLVRKGETLCRVKRTFVRTA